MENLFLFNEFINTNLQRDYAFCDKVSDHFITIDNNREVEDNIIGTYRLLRGNFTKLYRGFLLLEKTSSNQL